MYLWSRLSDTQASIIPLMTHGNAFSGTISMPNRAMLVNTYSEVTTSLPYDVLTSYTNKTVQK